ncbi:MAG: hypothetical protein KDA72_17820, partial [Planctomycetales bacterium]|nr:hypothetical protein [Planctomycetales bacterium]
SFVGRGDFNLDFLLYPLMGIDLSSVSKATLETLRLPPRVLTPFLVLILASLVTPRNSSTTLDRYYVKMKTVVDPDPVKDREQLEISYADPRRFEGQRMFPGTDWEMLRPRAKDIIGVMLSIGVCGLIIGLVVFLAGIGA